jgi:hypothetical protein
MLLAQKKGAAVGLQAVATWRALEAAKKPGSRRDAEDLSANWCSFMQHWSRVFGVRHFSRSWWWPCRRLPLFVMLFLRYPTAAGSFVTLAKTRGTGSSLVGFIDFGGGETR